MTLTGAPASTAEELKAEAERQLNTDPHLSLATAERLVALSADVSVRALGLLARADALRVLGRPAEAMHDYAESAELFRSASDEVGWARTHIGAVLVARQTGRHAEILASVSEARRILETHGLWLRVARLDNNTGALLSSLGRNADALAAHQRALSAAEQLSPRSELLEAEVLGNLSVANYAVDDFETAEAVLDRAVTIFEREAQHEHVARARRNFARYAAGRGHYSKALSAVYAGREPLLGAGRVEAAANLGLVGVECLVRLDRVREAVALAGSVIDEFGAVGAEIEQATMRALRAMALSRGGDRHAALADLAEAERLCATHDWQPGIATVRVGRAVVLSQAGQWQAALDEVDAIRDGLIARGLVVRVVEADLVRARALRALGDTAGAFAAARVAQTLSEQRGLPWLAYHAWRSLGDLARDVGDNAEAFAAYGAAIENLERTQGRILSEYRASFLADKVDVYEPAVELALAGAAGSVEDGPAIALDLIERARARSLVDGLSGGVDVRVRPRTPIQRQLADELRRLQDAYAAELASPTGLDQGHVDVDKERRIEQILEELRLTGIDDFERLSLLQGRVVVPTDVLGQDTALVEYFPAGGQSGDLLACVVDADGVQLIRLTGARPTVTAALDGWGLNIAAAARDAETARRLAPNARGLGQRLYGALVGPLEPVLAGRKRLIVVPYGVVHGVSFAALHDGRQYLVERFELAEAPSATSLAFCLRPRQRTSARGVVLAHSADGAVPGTIVEATAVRELLGAEMYLEDRATRHQLRASAPHADLLHLASHGHARPDAPLFSSVRLADGHLTAVECFDLELDAALVTLSACETGRGVITPGDDEIGLTRAFLYAGARAVVHSRWRIDDRATTSVMVRFYAELLAGAGRGASLRAAQLACRSDDTTAHPFYWAGFTLVGDWRPLANTN